VDLRHRAAVQVTSGVRRGTRRVGGVDESRRGDRLRVVHDRALLRRAPASRDARSAGAPGIARSGSR